MANCKLWLTHWGRVTHIYLSKLTSIGSDNGLSPCRHQAIIWTNAGILLIEPLRTNFSEILIEIYTFSFKKMHSKMWSAKSWPFCLGRSVLTSDQLLKHWVYCCYDMSKKDWTWKTLKNVWFRESYFRIDPACDHSFVWDYFRALFSFLVLGTKQAPRLIHVIPETLSQCRDVLALI